MDQNDHADGRGEYGRPLGRGLEDVSHLFLSHRTADASGTTAAPTPSPILLRPVHVSRDQLAATVPPDWSAALEEGLRTIDVGVPCPPCGEIDVLAVDRTSKLTIIDFDTTANDGLLLRGIGHFDWIVHNTQALRRMYPAHGFDGSRPPRLILLAPRFSTLLRRAMRQLTRPQVQCVSYHAVETAAGLGILFEEVTGDG